MSRSFFAKRIALLAALLLFVGATGVVPAAAEDTAGYLFAPTEGGVAVTGYLGTADVLTLPEQLDGQPVVSVGPGAFWGNTTVQSIQLPVSVTTLADNAFTGCTALRDLQAPGVTVIGDYALYGCDSLAQVMLGALSRVGEQAFGSVRPIVSVPIGIGLGGYLDTHAVLRDAFGGFAPGSVGYQPVTDNLLPLYERLCTRRDAAIEVEGLWAEQFDLFWSDCKASGLYDMLTQNERDYLDDCLDAMLSDLAADAARLAAAS